jgi:uncharacterized membrane protein YkoI
MNARSLMPLLAGAALCTSAALAIARDVGTPDIAEALKSGEIQPLDGIIKRVTEQHRGRVTEIELGGKNGRYVYEIDIVDDEGIKTEFKLDAKSGELLSSKVDHDRAKNDSDDDEDQETNDSDDDDDDH